MTEDLETLIRDAGREPTVDIDVAAVHAAGRRRAVGRRVAGAVGAAAVLALAVAVVPSLLPTPDIDIAPEPDGGTVTEQDDASPGLAGLDPALVALLGLDEPGTDGASVPLDLAPTDVAETLGVDLVGLGWEEAAEAFDAQRVRSDGSDTVQRLATGRVLGPPVVAADGAVWWRGPDGTVRRGDPATGVAEDVLAGDGSSTWLPVGVVGDTDEVLVSRVGGADAGAGVDSRGDLALLAPDGRMTTLPFPGLASLATEQGAVFLSAHLSGEHLVATTLEDDGTERIVHGALGGELVDLAARQVRTADGPAVYATGSGIVGDELWVLDQLEEDVAVEGGPTLVVRRHDLDGVELAVVELPADLVAGQELTGLHVAPRAEVVLVETVAFDGVAGTTLALFPAVLDAVERPGDTVRRLDGEILWAPARGTTTPAPLAACATSDTVAVNSEPVVGDVLFLCDDAGASLGPDEAWAFVPTPGPGDVTAPMSAADIRAVLELWAAGPTPAQVAEGLSGGLAPDVAVVETVAIDGGTVTVDLVPGPQVGVLGTTGGRSQLVQAIVGMVLADETFADVRITLGGDCEAWSVLGEGEACRTYDRGVAAWAQGAAACARDTALNALPVGQVSVWRWCPDAILTLQSGDGFVAVPTTASVSTPPTGDELAELVRQTVTAVSPAERERGLDAAGAVVYGRGDDSVAPDAVTVEVVGRRVVVDYDAALADRLQLSAPFAEGLLVRGIAGAVFQFEGFAELEFRVDGSCEEYEARLEGEPVGTCVVFGPEAAPWR